MFNRIALSLSVFVLLSACGSKTNLPSSVSYSRLSAQSSTSTRSGQTAYAPATSSASTSRSSSVGSRLTARQSSMQDAAEDTSDAESQAVRDAEVETSQVKGSGNSLESRSKDRSRCGANADDTDRMLCNGVPAGSF